MESFVVPVGYAEHAPPVDLASHVSCFWTGLAWPSASDRLPVHRVLPDGCVDIILTFGDAGESNNGELRDAFGVGTMTKPQFVEGEEPRLYVGVRFRPGSAFAALGIPASELTDARVSFELITRDGGRELERIQAESSNEGRLAAMIDLVRRRLFGAGAVPRSVRAAVQRILGARGNLRIGGLALELGISRQQLAKQFAVHVGVTPKMLARVMRTQAALARADAARAAFPREIDWSAIAYDLGYYDQPHFIDDFKALTGSTPGEWVG
jgi:AraC-like DNA-binding protein